MREVRIHGPQKTTRAFAIMDDGSTVTIIDAQLAKSIGIQGDTDPLELMCVDGLETRDINSQRVTFGVSATDGTMIHTVFNARTMKGLKLTRQSLGNEILQSYTHLSNIPIEPYQDIAPSLLIGQDNWDLIAPIRTVSVTRGVPAASLTKLGWVVHGQVPTNMNTKNYLFNTCEQVAGDDRAESDKQLHAFVKSSFAIDSMGINTSNRKNKLDSRAEEILQTTARRVKTGWETGLLWRNNDVKMPANRKAAVNRLTTLERKMDRDPEYGNKYCQQMNHLIQMGYAKKVDHPENENGRAWYLPHFGTVNVNKPGKLRLVFDASAKTEGTSLNYNLLSGPDLNSTLLGVLIRFRRRKIAFMGDIREMFLQIKVRKEDQRAQQFLWRGMDRKREPDTYAMTSVIFGATSSPCTAQYIMNRNAEEFKEKYPLAVEAIKRNHYVDDYLDCVDTSEEGFDRIKQVTEIHAKGGFEIRGWVSNDSRLMGRLSDKKTTNEIVNLTKDHLERALGLRWDLKSDTISFNFDRNKLSKFLAGNARSLTKRQMLSVIMSIYDPLGILLPFAIRSKILLQNVWRSGITWDQNLREDELKQWNSWIGEINKMEAYRIPRHYFHEMEKLKDIELHIFSDASDKAYSAVAYLRATDNIDRVSQSFVAGKARVGPLKQLSIPRMELQGTLMASRLAKTIIQELEIAVNRRVFWTDSRTVLKWIKTDPQKYESFVSHRLGEIDENTNSNEWRWVPSKENPADSATKDTGSLKGQMDRWLNGAKFLNKKEDEWPTQEREIEKICTQNKGRQEFVAVMRGINEIPLPDINHFSKWLCLIRCTAWVLLSPQKWRGQSKQSPSPEHLESAELLWVKRVQQDCFNRELQHAKQGIRLPQNSRLKLLTPMMNKTEGLLRVDGRINEAEGISYNTKSPLILDGNHRYTRMLIQHYHEKVGHGTPETVVNELRQKYWVLSLRSTIRSVSSQCQWCRIRRSKPEIPRMGELPIERLNHHHRPFTYCGMDYFGPMMVTVGRHHEKRWGVLTTCLTTRAIHIEIASSLSTDSAIMAIRRMMARRGNPTEVYTDNGTNMVGANNELRKAISEIDYEYLEHEMTNRGVKWRYIPPATPHMGGSWERLVRSVKVALGAVLTTRTPKEEILTTLLVEAEHIINSRPLTHLSMEHKDQECLTPNHFLLGSSSGVTVPGKFTENDMYSRKTWRKAQRLTDAFWSRWVKEYLPNLVARKCWTQEVRKLMVGDVVLVVDSTLPRNTWPKGLVVKVNSSKDGRIRSAEVKTRGRVFKRSTSNLIVLVAADSTEK